MVMRARFALGVLALLSACTGSPRLIPLQAETLPAMPETVIDAGNGAQAGGRLSLQIRYESGFKTQLFPCTINTHLKSYRVFLINGSTSFGTTPPFGLLNDITSRVIGTWHGINKAGISSTSGTQTITFKNVPAGQYYVAIAAYDNLLGAGINITSLGALLSSGSILSTGQVAVTDSGGEATSPGRVVIGGPPNYPILNSSSAPLGVTLRLGFLIGCI